MAATMNLRTNRVPSRGQCSRVSGSVHKAVSARVAPKRGRVAAVGETERRALLRRSVGGHRHLYGEVVEVEPTRRLLPEKSSATVRRAEIVAQAAATNGAAMPEEEEPAKFLGVKVSSLKKVVPLGLMFFCILFNYTILRDTKDVLVVTAPGSGAEIIPFLKTWVNLPMAIGFMAMYVKLSDIVSPENLFYICILPFIAFFGSFAYILYPLRDVLHPTQFAENLLATAGPRFAGPIAILRNWTFCLFYVMAELWGSVVVSVLFWGFANQITEVDEAKQFYPLFGLGANIALIFSGQAVIFFSKVRANLPPGVDGWLVSLKGLMGLVVVGGALVVGIYYAMNRTIVPNLPKNKNAAPKKKKKKINMSLAESFKFLASSTYVRDLAMLVVAYGISINLVEVTWKSKIKQQFPNPNDYSAFMGSFSTYTGAATFIMMLISRWIFKKFGWGAAAKITPSVLLATGGIFFALVLNSTGLTPALAAIGMTPLYAAVIVGAAQNIFSKSAKYSLFDPCKEMAYIPLDEETKVKGKAAIDVVCNPLGKSGGALIQQFLIISFGSLAASTPYLGAILLVIVLLWFKSAASLDKQFTKLTVEDLKGKLAETKAESSPSTKEDFKVETSENEDGFIESKYVQKEKKEI